MRSHVELTAITDTAPFSDEALAGTEGRIQVCFLRTAPPQETVAEVLAKVPVGERLAFEGREWFWLPKRGISDSRLPVSMIEALVGPMTMRTLGTVQRMLRTFG